MKYFIKNKYFWFPKKLWDTKKIFRQNCLFQQDILIYLRPFFERTRIFCFNRKKRYQKWKTLFCTKSMQDRKKHLRNNYVYFKENYKFVSGIFYRSYIFFLLMKNFSIKMKNSIFSAKIYKIHTEKMSENKIVHFKKIYNIDVDHFFTGIISFV